MTIIIHSLLLNRKNDDAIKIMVIITILVLNISIIILVLKISVPSLEIQRVTYIHENFI